MIFHRFLYVYDAGMTPVQCAAADIMSATARCYMGHSETIVVRYIGDQKDNFFTHDIPIAWILSPFSIFDLVNPPDIWTL
jgi:hypothetical protein